MAKRSESRLSFAGIRIEGGLLLPDVLAKVAAGDAPEQQLSNYDIPPGLKLRDEVLRYWTVGRALWTRFEAGRTGPNPAAVRISFARDLLTKCLEFELEGDPKQKGGFQALTAKGGSVPIIISGDVNIDEIRSIPTTSGKPVRKTPSAWLQTTLNGNSNALWGLALDGMRLRLLRDNNSLTRPAMIEVDLDRIFRDGLLDEFTVFWLLCHHTRFGKGDGNPDDCTLERWRGLGNTEGVTARDRLRDGVERAIFHLGTGFLEHPANAGLRDRMLNRQSSGADRLTIQDFHKQLLRLVYRLIFLMTAEDRGVLLDPAAATDAVALFRKGYSTDRLRERSRMRPAWDRHQDAYQGIRVLNRAAGSGEPRIAIPALGGIFGADQCPDIDDLPILNQRFLQALYHLSWMEHAKALVRINWRDMQTEELGSVYESLLELTPAITENATRFYFVNGEGDETAERLGSSVKGNSRKTTGSYYTPDSLVQLLLDRTLDPVIDQVVSDNPGNPEALLSLDIIDPACGSGHFLLGAARRVANKLAELRTEGSATEVDYRQAMRDVIGHCIYGVDLNDFAIELCRVALWLESVEPGKPLEFLENHIVQGNALIGVFGPEMLRAGVPDGAYAELTGDDKEAAKLIREWNKKERKAAEDQERNGTLFRNFAIPPELVEAAATVVDMPSDTLGDVEKQAKAYRALTNSNGWRRFKAASDAYVSAYMLPKLWGAAQEGERHSAGGDATAVRAMKVPTSETIWNIIRRGIVPDVLPDEVHPLHWFLAFPQVFQNGGFDVVVGNPPWEVMQLSEEEYFAGVAPEIAILAGAARKRAIADLASGNPALHTQFQAAKRSSEALNEFARTSGRFPLTSRGKGNTYALFAELITGLARGQGRAGVIVPTGIATDATTAPFFAHLVEHKKLFSLIDFENRAGLFPAIDSRMKFAAMTVGSNAPTSEFGFFLTDTSQLNESDRLFRLTPEQIATINPNSKSAPVFRSQADADLTAKVYGRVPILVSDQDGRVGNPWGIDFRQGLFNMTTDSGLFRTALQLEASGFARGGTDWISQENASRYVPLYEAKMFNFFDHRFGSYADRGDDRGYRVLPDVSLLEHQDRAFEPRPFYWVPHEEVTGRLRDRWTKRWFLAFKDVTAATNERTAIFSFIPWGGVGHTAPLVMPGAPGEGTALLLANLNSLVLDYCARSKVGGLHLTYSALKQFPVLPPSSYAESERRFILSRALELSFTSASLEPLARDLGYTGTPFAWNEDRRALIRAELDAFFGRKYGLTRDEMRYVIDPAEVRGKDYPSETFRILKANEMDRYGEFRTAKQVLIAWDRMDSGELPLSGLPASVGSEFA